VPLSRVSKKKKKKKKKKRKGRGRKDETTQISKQPATPEKKAGILSTAKKKKKKKEEDAHVTGSRQWVFNPPKKKTKPSPQGKKGGGLSLHPLLPIKGKKGGPSPPPIECPLPTLDPEGEKSGKNLSQKHERNQMS